MARFPLRPGPPRRAECGAVTALYVAGGIVLSQIVLVLVMRCYDRTVYTPIDALDALLERLWRL